MLSNSDLIELTAFRRALHQYPELSGEEASTAKRITEALETLDPTQIVTQLGGHGVAAIFDSGNSGETVLFRAELDGLPIQEIGELAWISQVPGKGHLCGHDGHMTMLLALGRLLKRTPIATGRVILMFQPAEEDGSGARAVAADPNYSAMSPDWAFAIHNEPGKPLGHVCLQTGLMNCASQGIEIRLIGKTAHAANPEDGRSPVGAVAEMLAELDSLGRGGELNAHYRLSTITHVRIGEPTFGVAPGDAVINVTLRTTSDEALNEMAQQTRELVRLQARKHDLRVEMTDCDVFAATINDEDAVRVAHAAMDRLGVPYSDTGLPMHASEDFGVFGHEAKAAMLCLGSGETYAALHNPDFDFPDDLLPIGPAIFSQIAYDLLGRG